MSKFYINLENNNQIKDNEILFIGCSHTGGSGHGELVKHDPNKIYWIGPHDTVYTHIFSKALGLIPKVDAHWGRSNYLTEEKLNTYNLKNKKVIIQFTDIHRLRLNGKDIDKWGSWHTFELKHSEVFTDEILASAFCELVKRVVNLLRVNNCQFLFFQITSQYDFEYMVNKYLRQYKEFFWINEHGPYEIDKANDDMHYGPKTMKNIAELLLIRWRELYDE